MKAQPEPQSSPQTNPMSQFTDQLTKQFEQATSMNDAFRAQAEKAFDFWMAQSIDAAKEGQKLAKEVLAANKALAEEWFSMYNTNMKEAAKFFTPNA